MILPYADNTTITERCHAVPQHPEDRRGFSETHVRSRLERRGWEVWRGGFLHAHRKPNAYPNVKQRYQAVERLLDDRITHIQYAGVVHHGMPDLLCYKLGRFKFVECKLGYETLRDRQRQAILVLHALGFTVELHRVVEHATTRRHAKINVVTGERRVTERQVRLTAYA